MFFVCFVTVKKPVKERTVFRYKVIGRKALEIEILGGGERPNIKESEK